MAVKKKIKYRVPLEDNKTYADET